MTITKQTVADQIAAYLHHEITVAQLVDWSERALMDGELAERDAKTLSSVIARLGVADVRAFVLRGKIAKNFSANLAFLRVWKWSRRDARLKLNAREHVLPVNHLFAPHFQFQIPGRHLFNAETQRTQSATRAKERYSRWRGLSHRNEVKAACRVEATCLVKVKRRREHRRKLTLTDFPRKSRHGEKGCCSKR